MAEEPKKVKPTTQESRIKTEDEILKKLPKEKIMKIPDDQVVLLPISGHFKKHIDDIMHFIMDSMEAQEIIQAFTMIRVNFKGVEPEQITPQIKALWTLISITTELNYQAAEQGKWVETDKTIGDSLDSIIQSDAEEATLEEYKQDRDVWKAHEEKRIKELERKKAEAKEAAKKKKKSNEDLSQ